MNKYDVKLKRQQQLRIDFNNSKIIEEKEYISSIRKKFMGKEGVNKEEYCTLIKYYTNLDINIFKLEYDIYRFAELEKEGNKISWTSMKNSELQLYNIVVKSCFILS